VDTRHQECVSVNIFFSKKYNPLNSNALQHLLESSLP
jgi:hypothetical protein